MEFRSEELRKLWELGKALEHKTTSAKLIIVCLDVLSASAEPIDVAFVGVRFDAWVENGNKRYGVMMTEHWLVTFGWDEGRPVEIDLEWIQ
jgi:plasmid maintenance system killer protein